MTPQKNCKGVAWEEPEEVAASKPAKKVGFGMSQPPLTALIDVFLFLIIFFLLSCQFHQSEGTVPANLPNTGGTGGVFTHDPIRVRLAASGDGVLIEVPGTQSKLADMTALYDFLRGQRARYADVGGENVPIVVVPRQGVRWGFVVDAFNQAVRAGFREVGVAPSGAN